MLVDIECEDHGIIEVQIKHGEDLKCPICGQACVRIWSGTTKFKFNSYGYYCTDHGGGKHRLH